LQRTEWAAVVASGLADPERQAVREVRVAAVRVEG
jgi:hypothetical protein